MGRYKVSLKRPLRTSLHKFGIGLHHQNEIKQTDDEKLTLAFLL